MAEERSLSILSEERDRVDKVLSKDPDIPRSLFSKKDTHIYVNGTEVKKSHIVFPGDEVRVTWIEELFSGVKGEDIPLSVLYEDDDIIVIDKKEGMVVHPAAGVYSGTLVHALVHRFGEDFLLSDSIRPGIVHRLDKDTSGVMVIAKTKTAHERLSVSFKEHDVRKFYLAIAEGKFKEKCGRIDKNIIRSRSDRKTYTITKNPNEGRTALTLYDVIGEAKPGGTLLLVEILTGRTHQIRVHLKSISHPIIGDKIYNPKSKAEKLMLHSYSLTIKHPVSGEEMTFTTAFPERFRSSGDELITEVNSLLKKNLSGK